MRYTGIDGKSFDSLAKARLHGLRLRVDAAAHGKIFEFKKMMARERGDDQFESNRYKDAWVDWESGYVRMYSPNNVEIAAIKIDTDYYRKMAKD